METDKTSKKGKCCEEKIGRVTVDTWGDDFCGQDI
jgi:hypothetical protein